MLVNIESKGFEIEKCNICLMN